MLSFTQTATFAAISVPRKAQCSTLRLQGPTNIPRSRSSNSSSSRPAGMTHTHAASSASAHCPSNPLIPSHPPAATQRPHSHLSTSLVARSCSHYTPAVFASRSGSSSRQTLRGLHTHLTFGIPTTAPTHSTTTTTTTRAHASSQPLPASNKPNPSMNRVPDEGETAILWAGFTSLTEKIKLLEGANEQLQTSFKSQSKQLDASLQQLQLLQQQHFGSSSQAAYSAMFLMSFLTFINFIGMLAAFQTHLFVPAAAKGTFYYVFVKSIVPSLVPLCNSAIVLLVCLQAVKVAWRALRW